MSAHSAPCRFCGKPTIYFWGERHTLPAHMKCHREQFIDVVITDRDDSHKLVRIYRNGRCYAATYAEPFPTKESALVDFKSNPKSFEPYNEATGAYYVEAR